MAATVVLLTRDLRTHDHPGLARAAERDGPVVPLFVLDEALLGSPYAAPNRIHHLVESLADLRGSLQGMGADLVVRRGDPAEEAVTLARQVEADEIHVAADVTRFARAREERLRAATGDGGPTVVVGPGPTVVEPGAVEPSGGDHYKVFTPYWRAWSEVEWRTVAERPAALSLPDGVDPGELPDPGDLVDGEPSPGLVPGGESAARQALEEWVEAGLAGYDDTRDHLADDDGTSHLGAALHFGTLSALETARRLRDRAGGEAFVRQLCWRDFHHQVTAAFPAMATEDYRSRDVEWRGEGEDLDAWAEGRTGYPIVDAGMRQLRAEGWMHNRARMLTASFLTKDLEIDWRLGAAHFLQWLVDGDIANNSGNWQWTAGTGNDTRPNRRYNPLRQADRFDPDGAYVRRYVPELRSVEGGAVHRPWDLGPLDRDGLDYPERIIER